MKDYSGRAYLLFPNENEDLDTNTTKDFPKDEKGFVLIDGAWKEARKIVRKSSCLNDLPVVSIKPSRESRFLLWRGRIKGTLCTIEAAMEILKITGEIEQQQIAENYFNIFLCHYNAGASSHPPKE
nr:DTW domain-containing protein [Desulfosporosinus sp. FKB]